MRRLKEDNAKLKAEAEVKVHEEALKYEDLRGFCMIRHEHVQNELMSRIETHEKYIAELEEIKASHEDTIADKV